MMRRSVAIRTFGGQHVQCLDVGAHIPVTPEGSRKREPYPRKSRMVEISLSGSSRASVGQPAEATRQLLSRLFSVRISAKITANSHTRQRHAREETIVNIPRLFNLAALAALTSSGLGMAAPAPKPKEALDSHLPLESRHTFVQVQKEWTCKVSYAVPDEGDPPSSYTLIEPQKRNPEFKKYFKEERYFANGPEGRLCKILMYFPNGSVCSETDQEGDEQFSLDRNPNGDVNYYTHVRKGKWLGGYCVSPDGKTIHHLAGGNGELVVYGKKPENRQHTWYADGHAFLSMRYREDIRVQVRLNGGDNEWLIVDEQGEGLTLFPKKEFWHKRAEGNPELQTGDGVGFRSLPMKEGQERAKQYPLRRAAFIEEYEETLKKAGTSWKKLDIEFIRTGTVWPH